MSASPFLVTLAPSSHGRCDVEIKTRIQKARGISTDEKDTTQESVTKCRPSPNAELSNVTFGKYLCMDAKFGQYRKSIENA